MLTLEKPYNQFSEVDEKALTKLCEMVKNPGIRILEIGCWLGHSTSILAKYAKDNDGLVICIDNFKGSPGTFLTEYAEIHDVRKEFISNMEELGLMQNIILIPFDSFKAFKILSSKSFDLVFIDGNHEYESVKNDIFIGLDAIKPQGIISGHDFEKDCPLDMNNLPAEALTQDMYGGYHCGVIKTVKDYIIKYNLSGDRIWWAHG